MIIEALKILSTGENLSYYTAKEVMYEITSGMATEAQIGSFLTALRIKGETVDEITAAAEVMKEKCVKTNLSTNQTLDIVGTGGDMSNTFNISTASAFVTASAGVSIAKHGNRALTSKSGSIDVLESLGINVNKTPQQEKELFNKLNLCFMFAQNHHPAMRYAVNVRKELKFRTLFNILGPLTNPACASSQLFGVFDGNLTEKLCRVILNLGVKNVLVVHGKDGLDEATVTNETIVSEGRDNEIKTYTIKPEDYGIKRCSLEELEGGTAKDNALIIRNIFNGKEQGSKKDIVVLNSALALYTFKRVSTIQEGVWLAEKIISSGLAEDKLNQYIKLSNED